MRVLRVAPSYLLSLLVLAVFILIGSSTECLAQASTATALNVSPACLQQGCVTTLTATVTSGGTAVHPGFVEFCAGTADCQSGAPLGTAQLLTNGTATLKLQLEPGEDTIHAVFHGTKSYGKSASSPQILTIMPNAAGKAVTVTAPNALPYPANGKYLDGFEFMSGFTSGGPIAPTGSVRFIDQSRNNAVVATAPLTQNYPGLGFGAPLNLSGIPASVQTGTKQTITGDFNNDGHADVAAVDGNGVLTILLGDGTGGFTPGPTFSGATGAHGPLLVGDFNGDGKLDIAIPDASLKKIHISLGVGNGTFTSAPTVSVTDSPTILYAGDFNSDGNADMLVLSSDPTAGGSITVLLGGGDGTFAALTPFPAGGTRTVGVADFNQDGNLDLAYGLGTLAKGNGDGTFVSSGSFLSPQAYLPTFVVAGDFDGDGIPDIAFAGGIYLSFVHGNGDLTFTPKGISQNYFYQTFYTPLITGAYRGHGTLETAPLKIGAIVGTASDPKNQDFQYYDISPVYGLLPGAGAQTTSSTNPYELAVGDFNGDGLPDHLSFQTSGTGLLTGAGALVDGSATATSTNETVLDAGVHNIVASYSGDAFHSSTLSPATPVTGPTLAYGLGFAGETGLVTNGSTTIQNGVVQLTSGGQNQAGSLFAPKRIHKDFITDFDFQITDASADGLAFVFQDNGPNALGSPGGGVGYGNASGGGGPSITNSFAFVLDLHNNQGEGSNSVRLEVNGVTSPAGAVDLTPSGIDLHNGHTYHVSIGGGNGNNAYSFQIFDLQNGPNGYVYFEQVFFLPADQLNFGMGYVGFTASTGSTTSAAKILDWTVIDQTGEPPVVTYPRPNYPSGFAGSTGLFYRSGAGVVGNALQLTNGNKYTSFSASTTSQVMPQGSSFYTSFTTDFDFIIDGGVGDGFAFVLQNDSLGALGGSGGGLGYGPAIPGGTGPSITNSLAIKFDLHNNAGESPNSTGIYLNGASPTLPAIDLSSSGIQLYSGHPFHAQITSDGTTLTLSITDLAQYRVFTKVLYSGPDLATMIPAQAYAGFTAGTGSTASSIKILNWDWNTN